MTQTTAPDDGRPGAAAAGTSPPAGPRRPVLPRILMAVAVLLVVAVGAGAVYAVSVERSVTHNLNRANDLPSDTPTAAGQQARPPKDPQQTGALNYVLLGSDSRDPANQDNGRSDTIMVVHLNAAHTKASIISFPRDMYVPIPGHGKDKINAAFSYGGAALTVQTIEDLTGVRMDHVVIVDFQGFIQLTEDLGGVTVPNTTAFTSHGYSYPKGRITIRGQQALWFVRERDALPRGDLDRAQNQRNVIKAIVEKGLSASVVADPVRFTSFLGNVAKHVTVDSSLSDAEIRQTALSLRLSGADIASMQAPISGFSTVAGQSVDLVDSAKMAELSAALKQDRLESYRSKYPDG